MNIRSFRIERKIRNYVYEPNFLKMGKSELYNILQQISDRKKNFVHCNCFNIRLANQLSTSPSSLNQHTLSISCFSPLSGQRTQLVVPKIFNRWLIRKNIWKYILIMLIYLDSFFFILQLKYIYPFSYWHVYLGYLYIFAKKQYGKECFFTCYLVHICKILSSL